ncbi:MAG: hypothetical protein A2W31_00890 [Planctomycetes bacterium RBG_16_64_10]|nr:MAG: hypothetical protein A2W31_00890 [Planctomycetes bacterium RBG_16_64_10]
MGFGDEFDTSPATGTARGTASKVLDVSEQGTVYPARGGYLITARGNPMPKVVRDGNAVIIHPSGGKDLRLKPLRAIKEEQLLSLEGRVAMDVVRSHIDFQRGDNWLLDSACRWWLLSPPSGASDGGGEDAQEMTYSESLGVRGIQRWVRTVNGA